MNFKIPLDLGFCAVFTDPRSGERTPTGAVRRGLRPSPHRSRGASGIGARTVFTATSKRADELLRERGGNDESANVTGNRGGRRVRPGRRSPSGDVGDGGLLERSEGTGQPAAGGWFGEAIGHAQSLRALGDLPPSGGGWHSAFGCTSVHMRVRCRQRSCGRGAEGTGPPQLDSAKSVPIGARTNGTGNRVSVKRCQRVRGRETGVESETRHRPPRRKARRAM